MDGSSALRRISARFDLRRDQADDDTIDQAIRSGVEFRGTNLWVLIFAIFIASIGLNVNSAAVIIGAMLISPLMGPIMGLGYGAGINDGALLRKSLFNLGLAALISLLTSALYFLVTPLTQAHSELLARTTPSIWDVLIALFGGLAGMIGATRRSSTNLVPGVAIATALMPPLCTAGYGLATRQFDFFFGAFYLFSINAVFIAFATLLMVRVLRLPLARPLPGESLQRRRLVIGAVVLLTVGPSVYLAVGLVQKEWFRISADSFVARELRSRSDLLVVGHEANAERRVLRVSLVGKRLDDEGRRQLQERLDGYGLTGTTLTLLQSADNGPDLNTLKRDLLAEFVAGNRDEIQSRDARIATLEQELQRLRDQQARQLPIPALLRELRAQFPEARRIQVTQGEQSDEHVASAMPATVAAPAAASAASTAALPATRALLLVQLQPARSLSADEQRRLRDGLAARFDGVNVELQLLPAEGLMAGRPHRLVKSGR